MGLAAPSRAGANLQRTAGAAKERLERAELGREESLYAQTIINRTQYTAADCYATPQPITLHMDLMDPGLLSFQPAADCRSSWDLWSASSSPVAYSLSYDLDVSVAPFTDAPMLSLTVFYWSRRLLNSIAPLPPARLASVAHHTYALGTALETPKTMTKEWKEAQNEYAKEQKMDP